VYIGLQKIRFFKIGNLSIYICHFLFVGLFANLQGKWTQNLQELDFTKQKLLSNSKYLGFSISKRVQGHKLPQIELGCHERVPGLLQPEELILDGSQ